MTGLLPDHAIIDGHRIAYGVHGEGPPVVLIHGTPSHSFIWRNVVPRLTAGGLRVHLFDLLGFGQSESSPVISATRAKARKDSMSIRMVRI